MSSDVAAYAEQIYAGVLGKIIGVYLGRPVEGWPYEEIQTRFGEVDHFVHDELGEPLIVADDDISGTFAFFHAVDDAGELPPPPREVGLTWLNYIIEKRTILWWGGVGRSTEQTAYFRLKEGIDAPRSGSIELNGPILPQQVGAQIFSDAFAMMYPGDPERAADAVRKAASVSHDGLALDAAGFLGALRALAFDVRGLDDLISQCRVFAGTGELQRVIDGVIGICAAASSWRQARDRIEAHYGYAKYPGPCHVVPNHAMTLGAVLLGGESFWRSIMVASSAGFDTDSNAGCVGCLNGIRLGLDAIGAESSLRSRVADRMLVVSADGGSCVTDAATQADSILRAAVRARGGKAADPAARFTFPYRGSTQGFTVCPYLGRYPDSVEVHGPRVAGAPLEISCRLEPGSSAAVSVPVFLDPLETAKNFSTVASPCLYPTQTVSFRIRPGADRSVLARAYVLQADDHGGMGATFSDPIRLAGPRELLSWRIPPLGPAPLVRLGLLLDTDDGFEGQVLVEEVDWRGAPDDLSVKGSLMTSIWETQPPVLRAWVSSAENFEADSAFTFAVSHSGQMGLATIGARDWDNYSVASRLVFSLHSACGLVLRAVGHRRFYAALFEGGERVTIVKQRDWTRRELAGVPFPYSADASHRLEVRGSRNEITVLVDGEELVAASDNETPYAGGAAGFIVEGGTVYGDGFGVGAIPG